MKKMKFLVLLKRTGQKISIAVVVHIVLEKNNYFEWYTRH